MSKKINIIDVTLRDGEQTNGVAFSEKDKLHITRLLLEDVRVDYVEVASARISDGELKSVQRIMEWANNTPYARKIEVLCFIDGNKSIDWVLQSGAKAINLLSKGSLRHVTHQLKKEPQQHLEDVIASVAYAKKHNLDVNIYLEDWSNGMQDSPDYVFFMLDGLKDQPINRFMLPDTLGILSPSQVLKFGKQVIEKYPHLRFDFHGHNDYDLSVANSLAAVQAGFTGIHVATNGLGERAGNTPLASTVVCLKDILGIELDVQEDKLVTASKMVSLLSGMKIPQNRPVIGDNVFTQTCGVHADGDRKANLYFNKLLPERFALKRKYALGKTSGKANVINNLQQLGIEVDESIVKELLDRIVKLGDKKEVVTAEDLPFLIADIIHESTEKNVKLETFDLVHSYKGKPSVKVVLEVFGEMKVAEASGDGQYDAFVNACKEILKDRIPNFPRLVDYIVEIPQGGKSDALVKTTILWELNDRQFKSYGLDTDQYQSSINATIEMINKLIISFDHFAN